jgi:hypothetical protein
MADFAKGLLQAGPFAGPSRAPSRGPFAPLRAQLSVTELALQKRARSHDHDKLHPLAKYGDSFVAWCSTDGYPS